MILVTTGIIALLSMGSCSYIDDILAKFKKEKEPVTEQSYQEVSPPETTVEDGNFYEEIPYVEVDPNPVEIMEEEVVVEVVEEVEEVVVEVTQDIPVNCTITITQSTGGKATGGGDYTIGKSCTLTATAQDGYEFVGWKEGTTTVSTNASYTFKVSADRTIVPTFKKHDYTAQNNAKSKAEAAFNKGNYEDAFNAYIEAVRYTTDRSASIKKEAAQKFKREAENLIKNNGGTCDKNSKILLKYAEMLDPTSEIKELLKKCN